METNSNSESETEVFLSYKREDRSRIEPLVDRLRSLELSVWFDASLRAGETFDEEIVREIAHAQALVVCWSASSVASRWVRSEAHIGDGRRILVPVFLEPCELPPPFNLDHTANLMNWQGETEHEGWKAVLFRIGDLLGRGQSLYRWDQIRTKNDAGQLRSFIRDFPNDVLSSLARVRAYSLELTEAKQRLLRELTLSESDVPAQATRGAEKELAEAVSESRLLREQLARIDATHRGRMSEWDEMRIRYEKKLSVREQELNIARVREQAREEQLQELTSKLDALKVQTSSLEAERNELLIELTQVHEKFVVPLEGENPVSGRELGAQSNEYKVYGEKLGGAWPHPILIFVVGLLFVVSLTLISRAF